MATVLAAIIGALALVLVAMIGILLPLVLSSRKHAVTAAVNSVAANEQVSNDHSSNLRVENDQRHAEVMKLLQAQQATLRSQARTLRANGARLARVEARVGVMEDTVPRSALPTPRRKKA